jgi:hypothetical protein
MRQIRRFSMLALSAVLLAACSKPQENSVVPLAFVPADTPYVYANLEPVPAAVTEQWSKHMQDYLPSAIAMYEQTLQRIGESNPQNARFIKVAQVLLGELKTHDTWDKLRQVGLKPDSLVAFYAVGLVPVMRLELGDTAAFRAEIAHVEEKLGEKIPVAKTADQEYWQLGNDKLTAVVAIEGTHLVTTVFPAGASDSLKQALLGITRPTQSLASAGSLQALAKQYGYSPFGAGYVDFVRLTERLSTTLAGSDAEFAKALGLPALETDATCRAEYLAIAHKFPRAVAGADELTPQRVRISAQLEIEPILAGQLMDTLSAAPGTGEPGAGVLDVNLSLPVLKVKDFWIKQADAIAAQPFACASLAQLNDGYRQLKTKIDITVPPPFSDLTGVRFTLDQFALNSTSLTGIPDVAGRFMMASNNPLAALAMAQLAVPGLKDLKLAADSKPVTIPAGIAPAGTPPLFAAMSAKAIAIAAGTGEDAKLGAYLAAPAATDAVFLRMYFSGKFYAVMSQSFDKIKTALPADKQAQLDQEAKMFALYEKWLRFGEVTFIATKTGIAIHETVEQN